MEWLRRFWFAIRRRRFERELAEELAFHRDMKERELEQQGADARDAAALSRRALGSVALANDRSRDVWVPRWLQGLGGDLRLAVRMLLTARLVSAVAVISLAIGIGANTAIFSLINSLLLRSLPVSSPQRLAAISTPRIMSLGSRSAGWPYPVWEQIRGRQFFDGAVAWSATGFNLTSRGEAELVRGVWADGGFFETLGVPAIVGRTFSAVDDRVGGGPDGPVAVIAYEFWQRRYAGAADAVGRSLTLNGVPFTIVGVTPPEFFGVEVGSAFDVIVPFGAEPLVNKGESRLSRSNFYWVTIMGRLKPGLTFEASTAALRALQPDIRRATMEDLPGQVREQYLTEPFTLIATSTGDSLLRGRYARPLALIMVVAVLVLLVACANVANLLLARVTSRHWEMSVRLALGSSRWRLVRPLLIESALLATVGSAAGLLIATWVSRLLLRLISTRQNTVFLDLSLDWRLVAFCAAVAAATTAVCGVAPALRASGGTPMNAMRERGRHTSDEGRFGMAGTFVAAQVALSLALVVTAGLMVRTFVALSTRHVGFERDRVLLVNVNAARPTIEPGRRLAVHRQLREAVSAIPGVAVAATAMVPPVFAGGSIMLVEVPGGNQVAPTLIGGIANALSNTVSPEWFTALSMPIIAGRGFTDRDRSGAPQVAIVNEAFARAFLNGANPVGHQIVTDSGSHSRVEIVGMAADAVYGSLRETVAPVVYLALAQATLLPPMQASLYLVVRSGTSQPMLLAKSIATAAAGVHPDLTFTFRPLSEQIGASLTQERALALLSGSFGAIALQLAALGLYGVTAYAVGRQRKELGIRMALGAATPDVIRLVLSRVVGLVAVGVVAGGAVSLWASRFVASLLYGIEPRDPLTFTGAAAVLAAVGLLAGGVPAWQAARIDPAAVLRDE